MHGNRPRAMPARWTTPSAPSSAEHMPARSPTSRTRSAWNGKPLGEKNPKWLQNDYVKFLRWAQWRIEQTGQGVLAFITSNSYLESPTFRGVRQNLMQTFDEIHILDLHGNSKKKESCAGHKPTRQECFRHHRGSSDWDLCESAPRCAEKRKALCDSPPL